jgi:hypothetical protein
MKAAHGVNWIRVASALLSRGVHQARVKKAVEKSFSTERWLNRFLAIIGPPSVSLYRRRKIRPALFHDRGFRERRS